ncbi:MAG: DUF6098 family protein [Leucobacter sp.]
MEAPSPEAIDEDFELGALASMSDLEIALRRFPELHLRCSEGPLADARSASVDAESGLELPGLPVAPLTPQGWWLRPATDWLARQLHRCTQPTQLDPHRVVWVLTGRISGHGPDCEPLLSCVLPIARLSENLLIEAEAHYRRHFAAGRGPEGPSAAAAPSVS